MEISKKDLLYDFIDLSTLQYSNPSKNKYLSIYSEMYAIHELYYNLFGVDFKYDVMSNNKYVNYLKSKDLNQYTNFNEHFINYYDEINKLSSYICNIYENNYLNNVDNNIYNKYDKLSIKEYYKLLKEFLLNINPKLLDTYCELVRNNRISDYTIPNLSGSTYYISLLNKCYIAYNNNYSLGSLSVLIHELGHVYQFNSINNKYSNDNTILKEVYSCYLEKIFINYLIDNNIHKKDAIIYEKDYLLLTYHYFKNLLNMTNNKVFNSEKIKINIIYGYACLIGSILDINDINKFNEFISYNELDPKLRIKYLDIKNINRIEKSLTKSIHNIKRNI